MVFAKDELLLPPTTPSPPMESPPSRRRGRFRICCDLCMYLVIICHVLFFLTITLPSVTSLFPRRPIFHLISGEFNLTTLTAGNFSGDWKLEFNVSNPPNGAFISIIPTSASVISAADSDVILAETDNVTLLAGGVRADVIQAHALARLQSPQNLRLDDAVLKGFLADRVHGFIRFNVDITLKTEFMVRILPVPAKKHIPGKYTVKCREVKFHFADEDGKFGVAETAPVTCHLNDALEDNMGKVVWWSVMPM